MLSDDAAKGLNYLTTLTQHTEFTRTSMYTQGGWLNGWSEVIKRFIGRFQVSFYAQHTNSKKKYSFPSYGSSIRKVYHWLEALNICGH